MTKIHQSDQSPEYVSIFASQNLLAKLNRFIPNSLFIPSKQNIYNISNITYKNKNDMIKKKTSQRKQHTTPDTKVERL